MALPKELRSIQTFAFVRRSSQLRQPAHPSVECPCCSFHFAHQVLLGPERPECRQCFCEWRCPPSQKAAAMLLTLQLQTDETHRAASSSPQVGKLCESGLWNLTTTSRSFSRSVSGQCIIAGAAAKFERLEVAKIAAGAGCNMRPEDHTCWHFRLTVCRAVGKSLHT